MTRIQELMAEFDQEAQGTRRTLERVPEGELEWRPHAKSMTLGRLAAHVAEIPHWGQAILAAPGFDLAANPSQTGEVARTAKALLELFERSADGFRSAAGAAGDELLGKSWRLHRGDQTIFELPRGVALRSFVLSHLVHHRGQLTVYLRLLGVPVPSLYGPSADEGRL